MALTESKLRQIIREEAKWMMESERTPRGLPTRRGEPRDTDPYRDVAYGRGDGSTRGDYPRGGSDEGWEDEERPSRSSKLSDSEVVMMGRGGHGIDARVRGYSSFGFPSHDDRGTVVSRPDKYGFVEVEWDNGRTDRHPSSWLPKA